MPPAPPLSSTIPHPYLLPLSDYVHKSLQQPYQCSALSPTLLSLSLSTPAPVTHNQNSRACLRPGCSCYCSCSRSCSCSSLSSRKRSPSFAINYANLTNLPKRTTLRLGTHTYSQTHTYSRTHTLSQTHTLAHTHTLAVFAVNMIYMEARAELWHELCETSTCVCACVSVRV